MRTFEVILTDAAQGDAEAAYLWLARHAPDTAARWFEGLQDRVLSLAVMPARCPVAPESHALAGDIRHLVVGQYRVVFEVRGNTVFVLRVLHGARLPQPPSA